MDFKLADTNKYYLKGTGNRFLHIATIHHGLKEYVCMNDRLTNKTYIEGISGGQLEFIEDDSLAYELHKFLVEKGILEMSKPNLPDDVWHKKPNDTNKKTYGPS